MSILTNKGQFLNIQCIIYYILNYPFIRILVHKFSMQNVEHSTYLTYKKSCPFLQSEYTMKIGNTFLDALYIIHIVCPRRLDPFHMVNYFIKIVKTSWTYNIFYMREQPYTYCIYKIIKSLGSHNQINMQYTIYIVFSSNSNNSLFPRVSYSLLGNPSKVRGTMIQKPGLPSLLFLCLR